MLMRVLICKQSHKLRFFHISVESERDMYYNFYHFQNLGPLELNKWIDFPKEKLYTKGGPAEETFA